MMKSTDRKLAEDLCKIGKSLAKKKMVHYLLGTISARISKNPSAFLVKPARCLYEIAKPEDFVCVDMDGAPTDGSDRRPSLNFLVHTACYRVRPDIGGVIHAHPENIVALVSQCNPFFYDLPPTEISLLTQEAVWMVKNGTIPVVADLDPKELSQAVGEKITNTNVVAIRNHGIIAVGQDIWEAYGAALIAESEATMIMKIFSTPDSVPCFRNEETVKYDLSVMPPTFSPKFNG